MNITVKNTKSFENKPIESWSNRDFLMYFSKKMEEKYSNPLKVPPEAWGAYLGRIKGFRGKLNLDNYRYKEFIDRIFGDFFSRPDYSPAFGAIVSEKVYHIVIRLSNVVSNEHTDWIKLRDELYSNNLLFQRFL